MNVLSRLWRAVAGLAESVEALAGTVGEANGQLRPQLALDGPREDRGGVIDNPRRGQRRAGTGNRGWRERRPAGTAPSAAAHRSRRRRSAGSRHPPGCPTGQKARRANT
jgi:hypothetical protein